MSLEDQIISTPRKCDAIADCPNPATIPVEGSPPANAAPTLCECGHAKHDKWCNHMLRGKQCVCYQGAEDEIEAGIRQTQALMDFRYSAWANRFVQDAAVRVRAALSLHSTQASEATGQRVRELEQALRAVIGTGVQHENHYTLDGPELAGCRLCRALLVLNDEPTQPPAFEAPTTDAAIEEALSDYRASLRLAEAEIARLRRGTVTLEPVEQVAERMERRTKYLRDRAAETTFDERFRYTSMAEEVERDLLSLREAVALCLSDRGSDSTAQEAGSKK